MAAHTTRTQLLATLVVVVLAGCSSPADREARSLKRGNDYFAAGNYEKARVEYRNALQAVPNDAEARYRNGTVFEKTGQPREAAQYYLGAVEVNPKHDPARKALIRLYIAGRALNDALDAIDIGLEQHPGDGVYLALRAAARMQLSDQNGAYEDATAAWKATPNDEYVVAIAAGVARAMGHVDEARSILEAGAKALPQSTDIRLALAQLESESGSPAKAEAWLRDIVRLQPKSPENEIRLAQFLARSGQSDRAEKEIRDARKRFPDDSTVRDALVRFLVANRGAVAAEQVLRADADAAPADDAKRLMLATFLGMAGTQQQAEIEFNRVIAHAGYTEPGLAARTRLAALALDHGDFATAERWINAVLEKSPRDADGLLVRGNLRLARGDARGAIEDLRAASRDLANSLAVLTALGRAHTVAGDVGQAEESFRRAVDVAPAEVSPRYQLARFLLGQGRPREARDVIAPAARLGNDDPTVDELTLRAALAVRDHTLAMDVVTRVRGLPGGAARAAFYAGLVAVAEGHREDALKQYLDSVDKDPSAMAPVAEAVKLLIAANRRMDAVKLLDGVMIKVPKNAAVAQLKGDTLLAARELPAAEAAYREALRRRPKSADAYRGLAYVVLGRGDVDGCIRALVDAAPQSDAPAQLYVSAAELLQLARRYEPALERFRDALKASPADASIKAQMALLILSIHDDVQGHQQASELVQGFADAPGARLRDAYAFVEVKSGNAPSGLRHLERLALDAPKDPLVQYHLGYARFETGDRDGAIKAFQNALESGQRFVGDADARHRIDSLRGRTVPRQ